MRRSATAFVVAAAAAGALMLALQRGALWPAAASGGVVSGLMLAVGWLLRPGSPRVSAMLTGGALVPVALLALTSPGAGAVGVGVAIVVRLAWVYGLSQPTIVSAGPE